MKKVLTLFLALILLGGLTACNNAPVNTGSDSKGDGSVPGSVAQDVQNDSNKESDDTKYATQNIKQMMDIVRSTLDMTSYEVTTKKDDGSRITCQRKGSTQSPDLSITVDGYKLSLPVKYTDLISAGWEDTRNLADKNLDDKSITSVEFKTTAGKSIVLSFVNQSGSTQQIKNLQAAKLELKNTSNDSAVTVNAPSFMLFNSVDNNSSLEGILKANDKPSSISISDDNEEKTIATCNLNYRQGDDSIEIVYYYSKNAIAEITMEAGISGAIVTY